MSAMPPIEEMRRAFGASDPSYDGVFFVGVKTTGIFCRPSCPARKPLQENTQYIESAQEAIFSGYRPCKRCRPMETDGRPPKWASQLLEIVDSAPQERITDAGLRTMGHDPAMVRRYFAKTYGMTFQAYCRGRRLGQALERIRCGACLDDVALGHGFESHSGFRDAFSRFFGLPPGKGRTAECIKMAWVESPLGPLVAGATEGGVCLLEFTDRRMLEAQFKTLQRRFGCPLLPGKNGHLDHLREELQRYFSGGLKSFSVPLVRPGTPFQTRVWDELLKIPYGETRSYEDLARALGSPAASRAVGAANGMNRIAIVVPCHRVVNKSGELGGYGGGLWRKKKLLELEGGAAR